MLHTPLIIMALASLYGVPDPSLQKEAKIIRAAVENLDAISFEARIEVRGGKKGGKRPLPEFVPLTLKVLMADGAKFRVEVIHEGRKDSAIVCDGTNVTEWNAKENVWTCYPARGFNKDYSFWGKLPRECRINRFCDSWVDAAGPYGEWLENVITDPSTKRVEDATCEGRLCDVFCSTQEETGSEPIAYLMKGQYTLCFDKSTHLLMSETETHETVSVGYSSASEGKTVYHDVVANPKLAADAFTFTPPKDSTFIAPDDPKLRAKEPVALTGKPAPAFSLKTVKGEIINLADFKDKQAVLLVFWGTWCLPCQKEIPTLIKLHEELGDKGLVVIGICGGEPLKNVKKFLKERPLPYVILHDKKQDATQAYGATSVPYTLLINKEGIVVRTWQGWEGGEEEKELWEELGKLLGESRKQG